MYTTKSSEVWRCFAEPIRKLVQSHPSYGLLSRGSHFIIIHFLICGLQNLKSDHFVDSVQINEVNIHTMNSSTVHTTQIFTTFY